MNQATSPASISPAVRTCSLEKWKTVTSIPILYPLPVPSGLGTCKQNGLLGFTGPGNYSRGHSFKWIRLTGVQWASKVMRGCVFLTVISSGQLSHAQEVLSPGSNAAHMPATQRNSNSWTLEYELPLFFLSLVVKCHPSHGTLCWQQKKGVRKAPKARATWSPASYCQNR